MKASPPRGKTGQETPAAKLRRKLYSAVMRHGVVWLPRPAVPSRHPLTVVIPLALKDLGQLERNIAGLRRHLRHPITEIVVPGQDHPDIAAFCARHGLRYINENSVLPEAVRALDYVVHGHNRNGWIRQQVLKLDACRYCAAESVFICDADTVLIRDAAFFVVQSDGQERQVLLTSDEYTDGYYAANLKLLGPHPRYPRAFVAHCMVMQERYITSLMQRIEQIHRKPWQQAILDSLDKTVDAAFCEYELYGNYLANFHKDSFVARYWFNRKADMLDNGSFEAAVRKYARFTFLSNHIKLYARRDNRVSAP